MEMLCLDVLHSDWHDYKGTGKDEDRLLQPEWWERLVTHWNFPIMSSPDVATITAFQSLRSLMQHIIQTLLEQHVLLESDIALLNGYLNDAPSKSMLLKVGEQFQLQQVPLTTGWKRVLSEVAISFAMLLSDHDLSRIKQCENPDCRWIYYDESGNQTRRWCEEGCANLMRVRRFRARR